MYAYVSVYFDKSLHIVIKMYNEFYMEIWATAGKHAHGVVGNKELI